MSSITGKMAPIRRKIPISAATFGIAALVVCILLVHAFYTFVVTPRAEAALGEAAAMSETKERQTSLRSIFVIIKDPEQETAIILALWATLLIVWRWQAVQRDRALLLALDRFEVTRSVHETAAAVNEECQTEAQSLDADNSMLRFVVWGIPAVGFIGTARGIGNALQDAQNALLGDISGVTTGLGITFNSTLTALTLALLMMFLLHQLQHIQDRVVLDTKNLIDQRLIARLRLG